MVRAASSTPEERERAHDRARPVWLYPLTTIFAWAVAIAVTAMLWDVVTTVGLGLLGAAAVAALLEPAVVRLPWKRATSAAAVGIGFWILIIGGLGVVVRLVSDVIQSRIQEWPRTRETIDQRLAAWSQWLNLEEPLTLESLASAAGEFLGDGADADVVAVTGEYVIALGVALLMVVFGSLFVLIERRGALTEPLIGALPPRRQDPVRRAVYDLGPALRGWVIGAVATSVTIGVGSGVGYWLIGLNFALPLALFAGITNIVPTVGPAVTLVVSLLIAATQGPTQIMGALIVYVVIQAFEGYVVYPIVMRKAVRLPPLITLFSVIFWGKLLGVPGLMLAVPLDLVVWAFARNLVLAPRREENEEAALRHGQVAEPVDRPGHATPQM